MYIPFAPTVSGKFVEKINRFVAVVEYDGEDYHAHIATSGRLWELLVPGATVLLEKSTRATRRTAYSLRAVSHSGIWVSIDAQIPNKLLAKALRAGALPPFAQSEFIRSEPAYGGGRFDFLLVDQGQPVYIEVKSVTLVVASVGYFPDAPTERGKRHLEHLSILAGEGCRCAVVFVIQRADAISFAPNAVTDPAFAKALRNASLAGVEVYAYRCNVVPEGITLTERLPVMI